MKVNLHLFTFFNLQTKPSYTSIPNIVDTVSEKKKIFKQTDIYGYIKILFTLFIK